jgi:hypothetical protein
VTDPLKLKLASTVMAEEGTVPDIGPIEGPEFGVSVKV